VTRSMDLSGKALCSAGATRNSIRGFGAAEAICSLLASVPMTWQSARPSPLSPDHCHRHNPTRWKIAKRAWRDNQTVLRDSVAENPRSDSPRSKSDREMSGSFQINFDTCDKAIISANGTCPSRLCSGPSNQSQTRPPETVLVW
jgi:hypothetical protein